MTDELKFYPPSITLLREDFPNKAAYIAEYRDYVQHYGKANKVRIFGGWKFFDNAEDMRVWKAQK
jgi:hypothetical protein